MEGEERSVPGAEEGELVIPAEAGGTEREVVPFLMYSGCWGFGFGERDD